MSAYELREYLRADALPHTMCPGCGGGTVLNTFTRAVDDLGLDTDDLLLVSGIGCSAWIPSPNIDADTLHTTHGRAIAYATGAKAGNPDLETVVISGDGDLAGIGGNHLVHAARRNVDITVILVNNFTYGMTGGQVAPTTPHDATTTTSPFGNPEDAIDISAVAESAGAAFVARQPTSRPEHLVRAIKDAIGTDGFALLEVISQCPTVYGRRNDLPSAPEMLEWMESRIDAGELDVGTVVERDRTEFVTALAEVTERAVGEHTSTDRTPTSFEGDPISLRIAGEGGQGVVVAGSILGEAAALNGRNVFETESYGSRARGGLASADLVVADEEIYDPTIPDGTADLLVALTDEALTEHRQVVGPAGTLVIDASVGSGSTELPGSHEGAVERVPFGEFAREAGSAKVTNAAVMGFLTAAFDIAHPETVRSSMAETLDRLRDENLSAFDRGFEAGSEAAD
ncbi:MAG: thiamine pyrophosphate-dependent enzyme [Halodesulfurarchaeum sp.]